MTCLLAVYAILGLLLFGAYSEGPDGFKWCYAALFPLHTLLLAEAESAFDMARRMGGKFWLDLLWVLGVLALVAFLVGHG